MIKKKSLFTAAEVTEYLGIADSTLKAWYKFKFENPENKYSKMLPDIVRIGPRNKRCWKRTDIKKLVKFQQSIPHGRNGVLGDVTQRYQKKNQRNVNSERMNDNE